LNSKSQIINDVFFDTIKVKPHLNIEEIKKRAEVKKINLRYYDDAQQHVGISLDDTVTPADINDIFYIFNSPDDFDSIVNRTDFNNLSNNIDANLNFKRQSKFLTHSNFNTYQSETLLLRYMKKLENKDLSLVHSMIPLGSCTMKLNGTAEMMPCSLPEFYNIHPFVPSTQVKGYHLLMKELEKDLCEITGYDNISFQPNSGAQGEYAGLMSIMKYFESKNESYRDVSVAKLLKLLTNLYPQYKLKFIWNFG
jgi:glycine dehydrogenase